MCVAWPAFNVSGTNVNFLALGTRTVRRTYGAFGIAARRCAAMYTKITAGRQFRLLIEVFIGVLYG